MSANYDRYLSEHKANVANGIAWLENNLPGLVDLEICCGWNASYTHDESKYTAEEYHAYDAYFYGGNRSYKVVADFRRAWLHHIHHNPHHWQYWVLLCDEPDEAEVILEMPYHYILEMICDWWAFSWAKGNLYEIFDWYDAHKKHIKLHEKTRDHVEYILEQIKNKLEELEENAED